MRVLQAKTPPLRAAAIAQIQLAFALLLHFSVTGDSLTRPGEEKVLIGSSQPQIGLHLAPTSLILPATVLHGYLLLSDTFCVWLPGLFSHLLRAYLLLSQGTVALANAVPSFFAA